jgi:Pycsar effector protein
MSGPLWPVSRRAPRPNSTAEPTAKRATEFAWRVHTAQEAWANKGDIKASILLAFEGGALYAIISAEGKEGFLARLGGWHHGAQAIGIALLLLGISAATIAVFPRLGPVNEHRDNRRFPIYFGHLRHWNATKLKDHLEGLSQDEELDALSGQLVQMAKSNWAKHRWVQASLVLSLAGILLVAVAAASAL